MPIIKVDSTVGFGGVYSANDTITSAQDLITMTGTLIQSTSSVISVSRTMQNYTMNSNNGKSRSGYAVRYRMANDQFNDKNSTKSVTNTVRVAISPKIAEYIDGLEIDDVVQIGMRFTGEGPRVNIEVVDANNTISLAQGVSMYYEFRFIKTESGFNVEHYINGTLTRESTTFNPAGFNAVKGSVIGYWGPTPSTAAFTAAASFYGALIVGDVYLAVDRGQEPRTPIFGSLTTRRLLVEDVQFNGNWGTGINVQNTATNEQLVNIFNRSPSFNISSNVENTDLYNYARTDPDSGEATIAMPTISANCIAFGISAVIGKPSGGASSAIVNVTNSSGTIIESKTASTAIVQGGELVSIINDIDRDVSGAIANKYNGTTIKLYSQIKLTP